MEIQGENNGSIMDLEKRSYRSLQQLAKSLKLPSNVKKVWLVQLIHAKKYKTEEEVNTMIQQVKAERKQLTLTRKRNNSLQNKEISSTAMSHSPPISRTPKRPVNAVLRYSPDYQPPLPRNNLKHTFSANTAKYVASSDRVLRSFNLKAPRNSYGTFNECDTVNAVNCRNQSTSPKEPMMQIMDRNGRFARANVATKRIDFKQKQRILNDSCLQLQNENQNRYIIAYEEKHKLQRTVSRMYPYFPPIPLEMTHRNFDQTETQEVRLRKTDGRVTTIKAIVQKRNIIPYKLAYPKLEITIQDLIDANINKSDVKTNYTQTPTNVASQVDCNRNNLPVPTNKDDLEDYSVYYNKKIRSEQVGSRRALCIESEKEPLPSINDAFSRFNGKPSKNVPVTDVCETVTSTSPAIQPGRNIVNSHMLESLYNFKNSMLTNAPLQQIATTSNTKCVYSTSIMTTAMAQQSATLVASEPFQMPPCEPDNQYRCSRDIELPHLYEALKYSDPDYYIRRSANSEDLNHTELDTSEQEMDDSPTIPEMVEDALEIISQDGDYMERMGMDMRMQCILCSSWAGPKILLEFHIRKKHPTQIHKPFEKEFKLDFTLESLLQTPLWIHRVLEHDADFYVISVKYKNPDCLMATLSSLCPEPDLEPERKGIITIYNKISGEPYSWEGYIKPLPPNLPYENDTTCLKLQLSELDLLPNSANLKLHNEELVLKSPTKVVVGQPEFHSINISLSVKLF